MNLSQSVIAYLTIIRFEGLRVFRIWQQTLLPPAMTSILYFVIFGHVIGSRVGAIGHLPYATFIAPGLIMMQMITGSYAAAVSTFYFAKFSRSIEELLVSPMSNKLILLSFMSVGMMRGFIIGIIVSAIAIFFTHLVIHSIVVVICVSLLATAIFSLLGLMNAVFAKSFDDIAIIPNFVITPLTYFGGVFYAIDMLPPLFRHISLVNPIYYIVDSFRYGFLGTHQSLLFTAVSVLAILFLVCFVACLLIFKRGAGLRP